jgi:ABC-type multidrug transport system fused ATPase/permease subunit
MKKYPLLYIAFGLMIILGALHFLAITFYFYWTLWWFDNLMHLLAGFSGGLITIWFLFDSDLFFKRFPTTFESFLYVIIAVLIVGVAWEIFEYVNKITGTESVEEYISDTIHDLMADALGAISASFVWTKRSIDWIRGKQTQ